MNSKRKSEINICIDVLMFILMMPIAGIGFLMKVVLISGIKRNVVYGRDVDLTFLGLDRHQWGSIHLVLSVLFLLLLLFHLILHWKMMTNMFKKMVNSKTWCVIAAIGLPFIFLTLAVFPLFLKPDVKEGVGHHAYDPYKKQMDEVQSVVDDSIRSEMIELQSEDIKVQEENDHVTIEKKEKSNTSHDDANHHPEIKGQMTISQVASKYQIPETDICNLLGVPYDRSNETLGRLRKSYYFSLEKLRDYILKNEKKSLH